VTPPPSENLLRRLARVNPTTAFIAALAVLLAGLFLPGIIGAALLFLLGAALVALTFTTWPVQTVPVRAVRVIMLVVLFAAVVAKVV
jgi:ABC-type multidrug transport system permease subunit